jgi:ribosomal protein S18 acetylase RimI-like enzyme
MAILSENIDEIDWDRLALIFERAPLGHRDPAVLRETFKNSGVRCFAWDQKELMGAGRALTDGVRFAVIFDVVVLPEYQGRGIGKQIMAFLAERSKAPNILLHAVHGKEGFYRKLGYRKMTTAMARFENPDAQRQRGYIE